MADVSGKFFSAKKVRTGVSPSSPGVEQGETLPPVNPPGSDLNSVGLSMPSAFNVANTPLTSNGTIAVTGAGTTDQYIRGDGSLASFPSLTGYVPYTGATQNVDLGEFGLDTGFVNLDTTPTNTPTTQGTMYWDDSRSTAALIMNGTLQHIGQDTFFYVKNSTGSSIAKGTAVRFDGTDGASGHLLIAPFLANGTYPSNYFMGVTAETIANGSFGQVMHFGELGGINTSGYTAGALLYASTTVAGGFQTTAPVAPNNIVLIAAAINSKNNGDILVRPTYGSNINQDEGVKIVSPTTGQLLQLQSNGLWENKTKAQVLGGTSSQFVKGDGSLDSTTYQSTAEKGQPNGYASLDGNGKVPLAQINDALIGNVNYQGLWNASTNNPTLVNPPSSGTKGYYYIVSTAGTFAGISFEVGDWIISNGSAWQKVDNTDAVSSVFGRTGNVIAANGDYNTSLVTENTNLYYTEARVSANTDVAANTAARHNAVTLGTANGLSLSTQQLSLQLASGSQNGALSSTDWTTFNSKQQALNGTGFVKISGTTISYDNSTYLTTAAAASTYLPLAGGTMTGQIVLTTGTGGGIRFPNDPFGGGSDTAGMRLISRGGEAMSLEIYTTNDADDWVNISVPSNDSAKVNGNTIWNAGNITPVPTSRTITINGTTQDLSDNRTYNVGTVTSVTASSPLFSSGGATPNITIQQASGSQNGFLSSTDWTTFNNKQAALNGTGFVKISGTTISYDNSTYLTTAAAASTYVPYTGATSGVDIGTYTLSASNLIANGGFNAGALLLKQSSNAQTIFLGYTAITPVGNNTLNFGFSTGSGVWKNFTLSSFLLTDNINRTYTLPDASGTIALVGGSGVGTVTSVAALTLGTTGTDLSSTVANGTTTPVITLNVPTASASNRGALSAADWTTFNSKENAITAGTTAQYYRGDKTFQTLNTAAVPESGNLYYTEARVSANTNVAANTAARHNAVTLGTANGLSLSTQQLSLGLASSSANGALSSTDWTTFNNKQNALTNPVTGTGTTNYLPKFTGTSTIGNSLLFDNGSSVGIGTTNLNKSGSSTAFTVNTGTAANYSVFELSSGDALNFYINANNANSYIVSLGSRPMIFNTNGNDRMTLNSSGNLGLGVTPSASWYTGYTAMQIGESASLFSNRTSADTRTTQLANNAFLNSNASNWIYQQSDEATRYGQVSGEHQWYTAPSGTAGNAISFTQAMTLTASGRLLIAKTNDEGFTLDVNGTGRFTGQVDSLTRFYVVATPPATNGGLINVRDSVTATNVTSFGGVFFNSSPGSDYSIGKLTENGTGYLQIRNANNGNELLRINSTGAATFSSSVTAGGNLYVSGGTNTNVGNGIHAYYESNYAQVQLNGATGSLIDFSTSGTDYIGRILFTNATSAMQFFTNTTGNPVLTLTTTGAATFSSSVTATAGIFNLNTTDGGFKIVGVNATPSNLAYLANNYFAKFYTRNHNFGITIFDQDSNNVGIQAADLVNGTSAKALIFNPYGGNVGIGIPTPANKLDVVGDGIRTSADQSTSAFLVLAGSSSEGRITVSSYGGFQPMTFYTGGSERMRITSGGQLLVGDFSSPSTGFKIDSNGYINIRNGFGLVSRTSSTELWGLGDTDFNVIRAGVFGIATFTARDMMFATNNTERMRITSGGNLLIGTTTDNGARLQVSGNGHFSQADANVYIQSTSGSGKNWQLQSFSDGNLYINVSGVFSALSLNGSTGAATFSSSVTAASFIPSGSTIPTNGMYLPSANTIAFSTNTTQRISVSSAGEVQLKQSSNSAQNSVIFNTTIQNAMTLNSSGFLILNGTTGSSRITCYGDGYFSGGIQTGNPYGSTSANWLLGRFLTETTSANGSIRVQIGSKYYNIAAEDLGEVPT